VKEIVKSELKLKVSKVDVSLRSAVYKKDRIPQTLVTSHFSHFSHFGRLSHGILAQEANVRRLLGSSETAELP
jgi:hypothetical protein